MSTGIRIECQKKISDTGEAGYKVTSVAALERDKLPELYLIGKRPDVLQVGEGLVLRPSGNAKGFRIHINDFFTQEGIEKINTHIAEAGQHLADVNAQLRKESESWNGKVIFVDGVEIPEARPREPRLTPAKDVPIPLAEKIAEMWGSKRLYYRDDKGKYRKF